MALRDSFTTEMKAAMKSGDQRRLSTVRMIMAGLKDRDIDARGKGNPKGIDDGDILRLLQGMVKQRRESIELYKQGNRPELVQQEQEEIAVIESFLPKQMSDAEAEAAIKGAISATGAQSVKDMGKVMAALKEKHSGQLDMSKAGGMVKKLLG
jgi:uncharacterized protein